MRADFLLRRTDIPASAAERAKILSDPGFGRFFTDHLASAR